MIRTLLLTAAISLASTVSVQAQSLTEDDVRRLVLDTLVQHPEILVEALKTINTQQLEARAAIEARNERIREVAANAAGAPVTGNPDGDITIVLFTDYNCDPCRQADAILRSVVEQDGNIRLVHRELPLQGNDSLYAAKAALAADAQGKYDAFHAGLMAMDEPATMNSILRVALEAGVDLNQMMVTLDSPAIQAMIEDTQALAEEFSIEGTPTYFIDTVIASGAPTAAGLRDIIASIRNTN
jgi:protein-disulfide isomerase